MSTECEINFYLIAVYVCCFPSISLSMSACPSNRIIIACVTVKRIEEDGIGFFDNNKKEEKFDKFQASSCLWQWTDAKLKLKCNIKVYFLSWTVCVCVIFLFLCSLLSRFQWTFDVYWTRELKKKKQRKKRDDKSMFDWRWIGGELASCVMLLLQFFFLVSFILCAFKMLEITISLLLSWLKADRLSYVCAYSVRRWKKTGIQTTIFFFYCYFHFIHVLFSLALIGTRCIQIHKWKY